MISQTNKPIAFGALLGRLVVGGFYLYYGINNLVDFAGMSGYATYKGVPLASAAVVVGAALLLCGGLSIVLGYRPKLGVAALVAFLVPVTMLMHNFWAVSDPQMRVIEQGLWMRNMALAGAALFMLAVPQPWAWSLDELLTRKAKPQARLSHS
ncbi:MAG: DoxX family protein [Anaerolineae bacterium]|nr:DoxX family protein [Anaerolineae bacterium]